MQGGASKIGAVELPSRGLRKKGKAVGWGRADCDIAQESFPVKSFFEKNFARRQKGPPGPGGAEFPGRGKRTRQAERLGRRRLPSGSRQCRNSACRPMEVPVPARQSRVCATVCTVAFASREPEMSSASLSLFIPNFGTILCCTLCCQKATATLLATGATHRNMTV